MTIQTITGIPIVGVGAQIESAAPQPVTESTESLSPEPASQVALSDDAIYEIAALVAQAACDDRKSARSLRNASERMFEQQTAKRIQSMRDKADAMRTAAMISGVSGMAAGAIQVAGGVSSMKEAAKIQTQGEHVRLVENKQTGALGFERELSAEQLELNKLASAKANAYGQIAGGFSGMTQSSGALAAGFAQAAGEEYEADAAMHQAKADRAERASEQHSDEMQDAKALQDKVMEFLKEVRTSQNATAQAAIRG